MLYVGLGGVLGALLRYQISQWMSRVTRGPLPLATLVINVTGSFLLGLLTRHAGLWFADRANAAMLLLGTGLCGAYTTFSTFSYEALMLLRERRLATAAVYIAGSAVFGLAAAGIGLHGIP
ncbi:MAG: fluoride efflux transporter CrcB [Alicyclobacillus sp.]|nr:fluoride efflux transporter CrcB [Alicyclobacillus sp.]